MTASTARGWSTFLANVWKVRNLVIVGTVSSICVLHTAASAGLRWFSVVVPCRLHIGAYRVRPGSYVAAGLLALYRQRDQNRRGHFFQRYCMR